MPDSAIQDDVMARENDSEESPQEKYNNTGKSKTAPHASSSSSSPSRLRYRKKSAWVLLFYIITLVAPWVMKCVLMFVPYTKFGYTQRFGMPNKGVVNFEGLLLAAELLQQIQTLLAIPIVSGLLAQAAVVYSQRSTPKKKLTLRQLLALAERDWGSVITYWRAITSDVGSRFITLAGLLILLIFVQPVAQSFLAGTDSAQIVTCENTPVYGCNPGNIDEEVGFDAEPSLLQILPLIIPVSRVNSKIINVGNFDQQPYLWPEQWVNIDDSDRPAKSALFWYSNLNTDTDHYSFFASALMNGTNTGVLRQLAMRMNSTSECTNVAQSDFPATCTGDRPFVTGMDYEGLQVRVCAPGAYDQSPWTLSRDRQDITEELWMDVSLSEHGETISSLEFAGNWTLRCTTNTTRGYFEVPNVYTNNNPGPLLDEWPSEEEMLKDWNDYLSVGSDYAIPTVMDNYNDQTLIDWEQPVSTYLTDVLQYAPGPLMISTLAMFGNNSWWNAIQNTSTDDAIIQGMKSICQSGAIPFTALDLMSEFATAAEYCVDVTSGREQSGDPDSLGGLLLTVAYGWLYGFNQSDLAGEALQASTYFANEAVLTATADLNWAFGSKWIYSNTGMTIYLPYKSMAGMITITVLVFLQLVALFCVAWYVHSTPVWSNTLDSFAMMRIGAELERRGSHKALGPLGYPDERDLAALMSLDGLVGTELRDHTRGATGIISQDTALLEEGADSADETTRSSEPLVLGLGAPGIITKDLVEPSAKRRGKTW